MRGCTVAFASSKYIRFNPFLNHYGELDIDTAGTAFSTVLVAIGLPQRTADGLDTVLGPLLACSRSVDQPDRIARVRLCGVPGSNYLVVVDAGRADPDSIMLNWSYNMRLSMAYSPAWPSPQPILAWCGPAELSDVCRLQYTTELRPGALTLWSDWSPAPTEMHLYNRGTNYAHVNLSPTVRLFRLIKR